MLHTNKMCFYVHHTAGAKYDFILCNTVLCFTLNEKKRVYKNSKNDSTNDVFSHPMFTAQFMQHTATE